MAWDDAAPEWDELPPPNLDTTNYNKAQADANFAMEGSSAYPNSKVTDPTISDAATVAAIPSAAKAVGGLGLRAVGAGLDALPATENLVPTVGRLADNSLLKATGSTRGQIKQMGAEAARTAAQEGRGIGLDNVFSTQIGREKALQNELGSTGKAIGEARTAAGSASYGIPEQIKADLESKYNTGGTYSGEAGKLRKSLNDVQRMGGEGPMNPPTHAGYAKASTFLNDAASKSGLAQPTNATTDVANRLSRLNNQGVVQSLGSEKGLDYLNNLQKMSNLSRLQPVQETGIARTMGSQGNSAGGGLFRTLFNQIERPAALRATSKGLNAVHEGLTQTPNVVPAAAKSLYAYLADHPEDAAKLRAQLGGSDDQE